MMHLRLLHLMDSSSGGDAALLACAEACRILGIEHRVWCLGSPALARHAMALGLPVAASATATGPLETALRSLWRARQVTPAGQASPRAEPDAVIGWSPASLHVATLAFARSPDLPLIGVFSQAPTSAGSGWLGRRRLRRAAHRATVVPLGDCLARAWAASLALSVTPLAPPVFTPSTDPAHRLARRAALGILPHELAVLMLADPTRTGAFAGRDVRGFAQVLGMAALTRAPLVGLAPRAAPGWERANRFCNATRRAWDIIPFDGPVVAALAAADLAVWAGAPEADGPVLAIAAAAAGVPVLAVDSPATREVLAPAASACLVRAPSVDTRLAGALLTLARDATARRAAGIALESHWLQPARHWAFPAELLAVLRIATTVSRSSADWWKSLAGMPAA